LVYRKAAQPLFIKEYPANLGYFFANAFKMGVFFTLWPEI